MRKWLIFIVFLILVGVGVLWWLGSVAQKGKPAAGEVRIEVDNVL